jgi:signal transduction histidine kinase/HD-like signal output (HDOD) protein
MTTPQTPNADPTQAKRVELILQQLEELPTLPAVAVRVLEATGSESAAAKDVVRLIETDVALSARILQLVHRADSGVRGEVSTVERAVVLLGFEAVRSAVLAVSVYDALTQQSKDSRFNRDEFWKHSVAVACCAELLGEAMVGTSGKDAGVTPSEAFVCGLLHDMGKVALDATLPKSFGRVVEAVDLLRGNIADVERTVIGIDHNVAGKRLAEKWQLPAVIRESIWLHGQQPAALPAGVKHPRMVNLVTLADALVREQHLGYSGNYSGAVPRAQLLEALSLSPDAVEKALLRLVERIEPRAKSLGLGEETSNQLYRDALGKANRELGRVTSQLAVKNRKLAIRAKFFDALSAFQAELRADAPLQTILRAIGQTAIEVLGIPCVGVFSLPPSQALAETLLLDSHGEVFDTTLIDCPGPHPDAPENGDGPVLSVGPNLEWLISAVSPRLPGDQRFWICLTADNACVGGVIWGAVAGEAQRLSPQVLELAAIIGGWSLALRTAQIREEARALSEQLADANRRLHTAQAEIVRNKAMISVGEMAAGAAHEMNNPLAVISGRSQLLSMQLSDPKQKHAATLIYDQSHRLSEIITELMDYAKPVPPRPSACDVSDLVGRAIHDAKLLDESPDRQIEITIGDLPQVEVDAEQVSAALREIIGNAIQATDEHAGQILIHGAFDFMSNKVVLTVTDNGCGMDEETLKRAFDPFFSSRRAGRRRGMGLAKALRWVECSGGTIRQESNVGQGTRTTVLLPAAAVVETERTERRLAQ